jgi:hypothetical protein
VGIVLGLFKELYQVVRRDPLQTASAKQLELLSTPSSPLPHPPSLPTSSIDMSSMLRLKR